MYISLSDIVIALIIIMVFFIWWHNTQVKERALILAKKHCLSLGLQLLDDSVAGSEWKVIWMNNQIKIKRRYRFEFTSTGLARYTGSISLIGLQQDQIWLSPHHI